MALVDGPLDPGVLGAQVDDVELVDPRRDEQQRTLDHRLGGRRVLDQLEHLVAEDHLAGRGGDVLADDELVVVGLGDAERALAALHVLQHVLQAVDQILAARFDGGANHFRIGQREIGRRQGADELAGVEIGLFPGLLVDARDLVDALLHPTRGEQIRLLDVVEDVVLFPGGILEAPVFLGRFNERLCFLTHHAAGRVLPQRHVVLPQGHLGLHHLAGVGHHLGRQLHESIPDAQRVFHAHRWHLAAVFRHPFLQQTLSTLGDFRKRLGKFCRVRHLQLCALLIGHDSILYDPSEQSQLSREKRPAPTMIYVISERTRALVHEIVYSPLTTIGQC